MEWVVGCHMIQCSLTTDPTLLRKWKKSVCTMKLYGPSAGWV